MNNNAQQETDAEARRWAARIASSMRETCHGTHKMGCQPPTSQAV